MIAVYDLQFSPASYDVVSFLCHIEHMRRTIGVNDLIIKINPGPNHGFRQDKFWPPDIKTRVMMRNNIVIPMMKMLPSVADVVLLTDRNSKMDYGTSKPLYGLSLQVDAMREGIRPLRCTEEINRKDKLITVTLRESPHWPERNSNKAEWLIACDALAALGYYIMVINDSFAPPPGLFGSHTTSSIAAYDLNARAIMYKSAICNMFVSNGPAWFALALDAPVLMVKPTVENLMPTCDNYYFARCGIPTGGQIPSSPAYQMLAWGDDTADNILGAFDKYMTANA